MVKFLSILSIILAIVLFPPAALALISNNAVPGDATYPIKRTLEGGIVKLASITPVTKAWFSVERSNRRFQETTVLIAKGGNFSKTLDELVDQTVVAAKEVAKVDSPAQKQELIAKLSASIKKYDEGLVKAEKQLEISHPAPATTPQPLVTTQPTTAPAPTSAPQSTSTPQVAAPTSIPTPTLPTPSPTPTQATPTQVTPVNPSHREVEEARRRLDEIQMRLEEENSRSRQNSDDRDREDHSRDNRGRNSQRHL